LSTLKLRRDKARRNFIRISRECRHQTGDSVWFQVFEKPVPNKFDQKWSVNAQR
jgi:hypothetical protein